MEQPVLQVMYVSDLGTVFRFYEGGSLKVLRLWLCYFVLQYTAQLIYKYLGEMMINY